MAMEMENSMPESRATNSSSDLSAGLNAAQYYLLKSVRDSTKQQVLFLLILCHDKWFEIPYAIAVFSLILQQNRRVYDIWRTFCQRNNLPEFGAGHEPLTACLSLVTMQGKSNAKVVMLSAAIANEHRIRMLPSPTTHETISFLFRGFRNEHPQPRTAKLPITGEILDKMYSHLYQPQHGRDGLRASVVLWRTVWRVALEYHTLGRFSDIVKLRRNVVYNSNPSPHLRILFKGGKNDQYSEGGERVVASDSN
jgi:hypothetical protein